jgi:DNA-binding IclR family transcriptional regulator
MQTYKWYRFTMQGMANERTPRTLKTVESTCAILNALKNLDGSGVTELANYLDISKGAAYNHLVTLHEQQFIHKDDENQYHLSLRFLNIGEYLRHRHRLYQAGRPETEQLAADTGEYAHLMTEEFGRGFYLYKARGERGIAEDFHQMKSEQPDYLHLSSTGKAILAHLSEERIDRIVEIHGAPEKTAKTITTRDELFDELAQIREQGYALNDQEEVRGTRAVGAPIIDPKEGVLGAISVSGPISRFPDDQFYEELPELVMKRANIIEVYLETQEFERE